MSKKTIPDGVWPTMITPFLEEDGIDYATLERQIDWYIEGGVTGLFAVCQSSEMFNLSLRERLELARACVRFSRDRVPVIASGHVAESIADQVEEAKAMADTGVRAVVLISNRFARQGEGDEVFKRNLERFLSGISDEVLLGFYECPFPYKRLISPEMMRFCVATGRFGFLKDTSCSIGNIEAKLAIARGSSFKLFNANAATTLASFRAGCAGYSGVMANFHADLYVALWKGWRKSPREAEELQAFLGAASLVEHQLYPVNAMYALSLLGIPFTLASRRAEASRFTESMRLEVEQLMAVSRAYSARFAAFRG
jgi:4-hydroxy-tetrahydrodipicolinate synthase